MTSDLVVDKDYVATADGLLFNVIGYEHAADHVVANLKYVDGQKWREGYFAALNFLRREFPCYVAESINVPRERIRETFHARDGLANLREHENPSALQKAAIDLASALSTALDIPLGRFGLTDSLLWGGEVESSDIDLVVYGQEAANRVLSRMPRIYELRRFSSLGPDNYSRDLPCDKVITRQMCERRVHKGLFEHHRFSLRAIRSREPATPNMPWRKRGEVKLVSRVTGRAESLFFPAVYQIDNGPNVVTYFTEHEAYFRVGDMVEIQGELEQANTARIVVGRLGHTIQLSTADNEPTA